MKYSLGISHFLEEISSLSHSIFSLNFFALITVEGCLMSSCYLDSAFRWAYLLFSPLTLASLLFSVICKASSDNHFAFLLFFFLQMVLITASCTMSWTSIHSPSCTLSIRPNPFDLFVTSTVWASLVAQLVKNLPAVLETQVWSLGWEDPLKKEMATHSSILAWKI